MAALRLRADIMRIVVVLALFQCALGIHFELGARDEKCLGEEVEKGDLLVATFKSDDLKTLTVTLTDNYGLQLYSKTLKTGKYSVTASNDGEYRTCFFNTEYSPTTVSFQVKRGVEAKDYSGVAKKDSLKPIELELVRLADIVQYIKDEFVKMEKSETLQKRVNDSTNSRVFWFSILSMIAIVGINAAQIHFLKSYFKDKTFKAS